MNEPKRKLRAAIYLRVSTEDQKTENGGFGIPSQRETIEAYLKTKSDYIELAGEEYVYIDDGISGATDINQRPALSRMFDDIEYGNKPFDIVIVKMLDRFARKLIILLNIIQKLTDNNIGFASARESIDTTSPFGKAMLGILGVFAELERDMILDRTHGGIEEAKKSGVRRRDIYGYRKNLKKEFIIYEPEAEVVRRIYDLFTNHGLKIPEIIKILEADMVPNPSISMDKQKSNNKGGMYYWNDRTIRQILKNKSYTGKYYYDKSKGNKKIDEDKRIESTIEHPIIIDSELFEKTQELYKQKGGTFKISKDESLLSGLIKCDCCKEWRKSGMVTRVQTTDNGVRVYKCGGRTKKHSGQQLCDSVPVSREQLDELVLHEIKNLIQYPESIAKYIEKQGGTEQMRKNAQALVATKEKMIAFCKGEKDRITDVYQCGGSTIEEFYKRLKDVNIRIQNLEKELEEAKKQERYQVNEVTQLKAFQQLHSLVSKNIEAIFNNKELARGLIKIIIEHVVIYSRPKTSDEYMPGRRKENQLIPYQIKIKFKLPHQFLSMLMEGRDYVDLQQLHNNSTTIKKEQHNEQGGGIALPDGALYTDSLIKSNGNSLLYNYLSKEQYLQFIGCSLFYKFLNYG